MGSAVPASHGPRTWDVGQAPFEGRPDTRWSGQVPSKQQRGQSQSGPADRVRTEEITLDIVSPIQGGPSIDPVGYDAAKKVKGRKRHAVVDTLGLMLGCAILPAHVQDRDGCLGVLRQVRRLFPFLERVIADGAYQGKETARAVRRAARAKLEIVKRSDAAKGFVVLQKRWIVERTFGWLGRCRRLAKDFEALTRSHLAFVQLAMIRLMMRRIARASQTS
jgi:transposase